MSYDFWLNMYMISFVVANYSQKYHFQINDTKLEKRHDKTQIIDR